MGIGNVFGGNYITRGQFPWYFCNFQIYGRIRANLITFNIRMSAILKATDKGDYSLLCGGILITNKHILSGKIIIIIYVEVIYFNTLKR